MRGIFRFSDKNQKAIDLLRTRCLALKSLVLCDGKLYEIMKGNFERADRRLVRATDYIQTGPGLLPAVLMGGQTWRLGCSVAMVFFCPAPRW